MTLEAERLRLLYELSRKLATFTDLDELLQFVTRRTRELLEAEGCAVLLHDRTTDELYFPIASQRASSRATAERIQTVRFPASLGIAGWALARGESIGIADAGKKKIVFPTSAFCGKGGNPSPLGRKDALEAVRWALKQD